MRVEQEQTEIWEAAFADNQMMWGLEPTLSAIFARDYFVRMGVRDVLIPGVGYGRNQGRRATAQRQLASVHQRGVQEMLDAEIALEACRKCWLTPAGHGVSDHAVA